MLGGYEAGVWGGDSLAVAVCLGGGSRKVVFSEQEIMSVEA